VSGVSFARWSPERLVCDSGAHLAVGWLDRRSAIVIPRRITVASAASPSLLLFLRPGPK
jgi:hypothetical protein